MENPASGTDRYKVLITGRLPPPMGGITTHVKRLSDSLTRKGFEFTFCDIRRDSPSTICSKILRHRIIHIHFSRPWLQLAFAILCRICSKKLIITYHGQWGRYRPAGNLAVSLSAMLATVPIVQNQWSFKHALRFNKRVKCISTYIPSPSAEPLCNALFQEIIRKQRHYKYTFCTNAWSLTFDKSGAETYGISDLVRWFSAHPAYLLLLSDPSGKYGMFIRRKLRVIPNNILIISNPHDFRNMLKHSDAFIRNTSTDGVSLSIHEARELNVPVLASDAVERPAFCCTFSEFAGIDIEVKLAEARRLIALPVAGVDTAGALMEIYKELGRKRRK